MKREVYFILSALLLVLTLWIRILDLGERSMHTDEAVHAMRLANFKEEGRVVYDPLHFHGPWLYQVSLLLTSVGPEDFLDRISETQVRWFAVLGGLLTLCSVFLFAREWGRIASLVALALAGFSPGLVYYSRYFIAEIWLVGLVWLAAWAGWRYFQSGKLLFAGMSGLCVGIAHATKETVIISIAVAIIAVVILGVGRKLGWVGSTTDGSLSGSRLRYLLIGSAVALLSSVLLYSHFFTHLPGIVDSVRTYFLYEVTEGHEKPIWYYAWFLFSPEAGFLETGLGLAALPGVVLVLVGLMRNKPSEHGGLLLFVLLITIGHFCAYSLIGYKTPWLILTLLPGLAILGGVGAAKALAHLNTSGFAWAGLGLIAVGILLGLGSSLRINFKDPTNKADSNYYAYVHTDPGIRKLVDMVDAQAERWNFGDAMEIVVFGSEYWPLPYYLRHYPNAGFWAEKPEGLDAPFIVASTQGAEGFEFEIIGLDYSLDIKELRYGVFLIIHQKRLPEPRGDK